MLRSALLIVVSLAGLASANQPEPRPKSKAWHEAVNAAYPAMEECSRRATAAGVYGEVKVAVDDLNRWKVTSTKSLGAQRSPLEKCVREAMSKGWDRFKLSWDYDDTTYFGKTERVHRLGTPRMLLPAAPMVMPIWKKAVFGKDAGARSTLAKLLPPDYALTRDTCLQTTWSGIENLEYLWLPTVGTWVPRLWEKALPKALGMTVHLAMWDPTGAFIAKTDHGLCLVEFPAAKQAALRTEFDTVGSCWAGGFEDILLRPKVALPSTKKYTQVVTEHGRTCAVSTTNDVTCCGPVDPKFPAAPGQMTSIALGTDFACGLEPGTNAARCWGNITAPPAGAFTKIAAGHNVACGLRSNRELACWGQGAQAAAAPAGAFVDVAMSSMSACGVRASGAVECFGGSIDPHPAGKFASVALGTWRGCGLRTDGTIGCWGDKAYAVDSPLTGTFKEIANGGANRLCGRRTDDSVVCQGPYPAPPTLLSSKLVKLDAGGDQTCGLRADGSVDCFGEVWPGKWLGDNTWTWPDVLGLTGNHQTPSATQTISGRILDEHGAPIAGAEILICDASGPCRQVAREAMTSVSSLATLAAALPWAKRSMYTVARSGLDGTYRTTFTTTTLDAHRGIELVVTAPGRELIERYGSIYNVATNLSGPIMLRPASPIDLEPTCARSRCPEPVRSSTSDHHHFQGLHLERLPPGTHTLRVRRNATKPDEEYGTAVVDVGFAVKPQRVQVKMSSLGTGKSIKGTATLTKNGMAVSPVTVKARCGGEPTVYRDAKTDAAGNFELRDVGQPPCTVELGPFMGHPSGNHSVTLDKLPATGVKLDATVYERDVP